MADLSGRVSELEDQIAFLTQDLLRRPDIDTISQLQNLWNQRYSSVTDVYNNLDSEVQELQILYANLVLGSGTHTTTTTGLAETFETVSKNLKQYPYSLTYDTGDYLTSVRYQISDTSYVMKSLSYNSSGQLYLVGLTGNPVPSVSLFKHLYYSGSNITGVSYS